MRRQLRVAAFHLAFPLISEAGKRSRTQISATGSFGVITSWQTHEMSNTGTPSDPSIWLPAPALIKLPSCWPMLIAHDVAVEPKAFFFFFSCGK
jgi:hypothetical protein